MTEDRTEEFDEAFQHIRDLEDMKAGFDKMYKALDKEHKRLMKEFQKKLDACQKMLVRLRAELARKG